jgi:Flp pilus assembly protein TadD
MGRAARFYIDALASNPTAPELWEQLGNCLKSAGKSAEAEFAHGRAAALVAG